MTIQVETHRYQTFHGRPPRGTGLWSFQFTTDAGTANELKSSRFFHGTYAQAKQQALREARDFSRRHPTHRLTVEVMP